MKLTFRRQWPWVLVLAWLSGCAHDAARPGGNGSSAPEDLSLPQSQRYQQADDGSPEHAALEAIANLEEPVPQVEPRSRYGNGPVYTVRGKTYHVLDSARGYKQRGTASWYGTKFHGHLTSSLEPYDMYKFSAAHKTLPLPTYARVTNLDNGTSVIVRINDRGPFHGQRLIDVSYAAAVRLGIWKQGTGRVEVETINPRSEELPLPPTVSAELTGPRVYLQAGAFADMDNAQELAERLREMQLGQVRVVSAMVGGRKLQRVRLGPLRNALEADRLKQKLTQHGMPSAQVVIQ